MKDLMGNEIVVGSLIAYPGHFGSTTYMNVGRVVGFGEKKDWRGEVNKTLKVKKTKSSIEDVDENVRVSSVSNIRNVIVVKESLSGAEEAHLDDTEEVVGSSPT